MVSEPGCPALVVDLFSQIEEQKEERSWRLLTKESTKDSQQHLNSWLWLKYQTVSFTLKKHEILRSKKEIQELFENGSSFFLYPFKVYSKPNPDTDFNRVLFSVSKKYFKKAANLNRPRYRHAIILADSSRWKETTRGLSRFAAPSLSRSHGLVWHGTI